MTAPKFQRFAWGVLAYNLLVIVWGAFVRASGSGAGCGKHWPLCNGEVAPRAATTELVIELSHRVTSGIALVLVVALAVVAFRSFPKGSAVRKAAGLSVLFMFSEAGIGAALVLLEHVAHNPSLKRGVSMGLHLGNTFLLLATLAALPFFAAGAKAPSVRGNGPLAAALAVTCLGFLGVGVSGAIAALGDTLFPSTSLSAGLVQDASSSAHLFLRLRSLHPFGALLLGALVTFATFACRIVRRYEPVVVRRARLLNVLFLAQLGLGLLNLVLLVPIATQLMHLLLADIVWIAFVQLTLASLQPANATVAVDPAARPLPSRPEGPPDRKDAADETAVSV